MNDFEAMGFSPEQVKQLLGVYERASIVIADANKAFEAMAAVLRPTTREIARTWSAMQAAHFVPRQYRDTMQRRKLRKIYRVK